MGDLANVVSSKIGCLGKEPTIWQRLDFDEDCNYEIENLNNIDARIVWAGIAFVVFVLPFIICFMRICCCRK